MQIYGMGLDLDGQRLFPAADSDMFTAELIDALTVNGGRVRALTRSGTRGIGFRGEQPREVIDVGDVRSAGWTFLVNQADPRRADLIAALAPLATHRGMQDPAAPLLYSTGDPDEWGTWLEDSYYALALEGKTVPRYVLIVGGPDQIPFAFQSLLDTVANVGRVDFETVDQLVSYAAKLIRLEQAADPVVSREAVVFATDAGPNDATHFSRLYMAEPIADLMDDDLKLTTTRVLGEDATKAGLGAALAGRNPAIVYTASHGLGATGKPFDVKLRYNGSICCQPETVFGMNDLFGAGDVPSDAEPFLEGSVFFQFACYGYGTPAVSEYAHWLKKPPKDPQLAERDFVAALPKRLLAHPRGPIAFIGHLDTAFLHGFTDGAAPETLDRWHNRIQPFVSAIRTLLAVQATGLAMQPMNERYNTLNALLANTYDRIQRGKMQWTTASQSRFLDSWITRGDAQNYMVFGDPGVRLRLPAA
ncbi:MAG: hypothetical protein ABI647_06940 [Gemmatimonadota bacterium]